MKSNLPDLIYVSGAPRTWNLRVRVLGLLKALRKVGLIPTSSQAVISISCVNLIEMTKLNAKFRGRRTPTDVLSFEQPHSVKIKGSVFLGDLVLCREVVRAQARDFGHSVQTELDVLLVHGAVHLFGYDHERSAKEARRMESLETKILRSLGGQSQRTGLIRRSKVND